MIRRIAITIIVLLPICCMFRANEPETYRCSSDHPECPAGYTCSSGVCITVQEPDGTADAGTGGKNDLSHEASVIPGKILAWRPMPSPATKDLRDAWGASEKAVWAVGDEGTILFYDGANGPTQESGTIKSFRCIWGQSNSFALAAGAEGALFAYDGGTWTDMKGTGNQFNAVWGLAKKLSMLWVTKASPNFIWSNWSPATPLSRSLTFSGCGAPWKKIYSWWVNRV